MRGASNAGQLNRDAVIVESTYGVSRHEERLTREARLTSKVREIISRGGRVLMPVVALGRAQVSAHHPIDRSVYLRDLLYCWNLSPVSFP